MFWNWWYKKERPLPTMMGMGGGATSLGLHAASGAGPNLSSSGGIISEFSTDPTTHWRTHVFTNSGAYIVNTAPTPGACDIFLMGGGGGGSAGFASYGPGAGGGGGGWVEATGYPVSTITYPVVVGQGGAAGHCATPNGSSYPKGLNGGGTILYNPLNQDTPAPRTLHAMGGGGAGGGPTNSQGTGPDSVGCGGGGGYGPGPTNGPQAGLQPQANSTPNWPTFLINQPYVTGALAQYGNPGGSGDSSNVAGAGAGGGAADPGQSYQGSTSTKADGGNGRPNTYKGWDTEYGKGGSANGPQPNGVEKQIATRGWGGAGSRKNISGYAAYTGGDGGSGILCVRYKIAEKLAGLSAKATGGAISQYDGKIIHTFFESGTFTNTSPGPMSVEYVVIGGGGSGGSGENAGGGGAGAVLTSTATCPTSAVTVYIGRGGGWVQGPFSDAVNGKAGENTTLTGGMSVTAPGGGYGGANTSPGSGGPGGSGGGGCFGPNPGGPFGAPGPSNSPGGNAGGAGATPSDGGPAYGAGGGGGAGGAGMTGTGSNAGSGGIGVQLPATFQDPDSSVGAPGPGDTKYWVGGGGGGGSDDVIATRGWGGAGPGGSPTGVPFAGGGNGGYSPNPGPQGDGTQGLENTGGGGGGTGVKTRTGGAGGSGIVLIAYPA